VILAPPTYGLHMGKLLRAITGVDAAPCLPPVFGQPHYMSRSATIELSNQEDIITLALCDDAIAY
jgi:hypothetical protein